MYLPHTAAACATYGYRGRLTCSTCCPVRSRELLTKPQRLEGKACPRGETHAVRLRACRHKFSRVPRKKSAPCLRVGCGVSSSFDSCTSLSSLGKSEFIFQTSGGPEGIFWERAVATLKGCSRGLFLEGRFFSYLIGFPTPKRRVLLQTLLGWGGSNGGVFQSFNRRSRYSIWPLKVR